MHADPASSIAPFAVHGGRVDLARAAYPGVEAWIDLSTGLAPWSYPYAISPGSNAHLPDPAALAALEAAAASVFGVAAKRVVAVPGSDLGLRLLAAVIGGEAAVVRPGYSGHWSMWPAGAVTAVVAAELESAATAGRSIVLARPNNPDGLVIDRDRLEALAAKLAAHGRYLIVDEAFVDATPDASLAASGWPGLIVVRSFGKFFGLAGLRLGFVIAPVKIADGLRQLLGDWPIGGAAIALGTVAYADRDWQAAQRNRLDDAASALDRRLDGAGLEVIGGTRYFRLVMTPRRDAVFDRLARAGILTRPFAGQADWLRLGLPSNNSDWARLDAALDTWSRA